jgi:predicted secreted protein
MGGPFTMVAIYLTIWWTVLFAVLPIGVVSHHEAGIDNKDGADPGSPVDPKLKKKFITTTWISAVVFSLLWLAIHFHVFNLEKLPWRAQSGF